MWKTTNFCRRRWAYLIVFNQSISEINMTKEELEKIIDKLNEDIDNRYFPEEWGQNMYRKILRLEQLYDDLYGN